MLYDNAGDYCLMRVADYADRGTASYVAPPDEPADEQAPARTNQIGGRSDRALIGGLRAFRRTS